MIPLLNSGLRILQPFPPAHYDAFAQCRSSVCIILPSIRIRCQMTGSCTFSYLQLDTARLK
ncbi:hypothetical protein BDN71DRAFT_1212873 [Pleurotus eryngii]|uniref:Uncharacterized protein n=1 Tax=Pleurotus eryngii TaxID=5323 RepID=A0A9P6DEA6_PLEER|nr:hypothetical protein BDN71DRAFT_1212873 [Pleurotus eryngii]